MSVNKSQVEHKRAVEKKKKVSSSYGIKLRRWERFSVEWE